MNADLQLSFLTFLLYCLLFTVNILYCNISVLWTLWHRHLQEQSRNSDSDTTEKTKTYIRTHAWSEFGPFWIEWIEGWKCSRYRYASLLSLGWLKEFIFIYFQTVLEVGAEQPNPTVNTDSKQFSQQLPVISTNWPTTCTALYISSVLGIVFLTLCSMD